MSKHDRIPNESVEPVREGAFVELRRRMFGVDVSIGLDRDNEPFRANIDMAEKKANFRVTPDGILRGLKAFDNFMSSEGGEEIVSDLRELRKRIQKSTENRRRENDERTIQEYAEQEGVTVGKAMEGLLDKVAEVPFDAETIDAEFTSEEDETEKRQKRIEELRLELSELEGGGN